MTDKPQFDIYPQLDREIQAASQPVEPDSLAETVQKDLEAPKPDELQLWGEIGSDRAMELYDWANPQIEKALSSWKQYRDGMADTIPSPGLFTATHKDFPATIDRLYRAQKDLEDRLVLTPDGKYVSQTMKLVLIPWREFNHRLFKLNEWLVDMRGQPGKDHMPDKLVQEIHNDHPYYRHPDDPESLLTGGEYLDIMMEKDGPWGIMLIQAEGKPGTQQYKNATPNALTLDGKGKLGVSNAKADYSFSDMGLFEWLALTLQQDPNTLANGSNSWLIANRIEYDAGDRVPAAGVQMGSGVVSYILLPADAAPMSPDTNIRYCIGSPHKA